jgi:hypothetical protein
MKFNLMPVTTEIWLVPRVSIRRNELKLDAPGASLLGTWDSKGLVSPVSLSLDICWVSLYGGWAGWPGFPFAGMN